MSTSRLPPNASIGRVTLRVASLDKSLAFYRDLLGLSEISRHGDTVALAPAGKKQLITLVEVAGTRPRPPGAVGLYHMALLLPSRRELGMAMLHLFQERWPFSGFADHAVSEAAYLSDPDGNGIELYADRPAEDWPHENGQIAMTTLALNVNSLIRGVDGEEWNGIHPATRIGHLHMHVSDLERAEQFYDDVLGFDVMVRGYPGALFLAAGGYHHHIGINTWLQPQSGDARSNAGLLGYELKVGSELEQEELRERARDASVPIMEAEDGFVVRDQDGVPVTVVS